MNKRRFVWFAVAYVTILSAVSVAIAEYAEPVIATLYVSADVTRYLRGREKPDQHSSVEARFSAGDELEVVEFEDEWTRVIGGETGTVWVSNEYITAENPKSEPKKYVVAGNGRVHVRNTPGGDHVRFAELGESIAVYGWSGEWAVVDGGFILGYYLEEEKTEMEKTE